MSSRDPRLRKRLMIADGDLTEDDLFGSSEDEEKSVPDDRLPSTHSQAATPSSSQLSNDQFSLLLTAINKSKQDMAKDMTSQLNSFKQEIRRNHEDTSERLAKQMKKSKAVEFKRKGNEKQHNFNE